MCLLLQRTVAVEDLQTRRVYGQSAFAVRLWQMHGLHYGWAQGHVCCFTALALKDLLLHVVADMPPELVLIAVFAAFCGVQGVLNSYCSCAMERQWYLRYFRPAHGQ